MDRFCSFFMRDKFCKIIICNVARCCCDSWGFCYFHCSFRDDDAFRYATSVTTKEHLLPARHLVAGPRRRKRRCTSFILVWRWRLFGSRTLYPPVAACSNLISARYQATVSEGRRNGLDERMDGRPLVMNWESVVVAQAISSVRLMKAAAAPSPSLLNGTDTLTRISTQQ